MSTEHKAMATRDGFGKAIVQLTENPQVVVLDADLCSSTRSEKFGEQVPERFFNVGIAEQNLVGLAAGLAKTGKIPFACSFAAFLPNRAHDQIRLCVAYNKLNVKLVATHAGLLTGEDGASAQELGDIGTLNTLPGLAIIQPADGLEAEQATLTLAKQKGPAYLRLTRAKVPSITEQHYAQHAFKIGKGVVLEEGSDAVIFATGVMVNKALQAATILREQGMSIAVVNIHTIKPLDKELVLQYAKKTQAVVTAEDHSVIGGLGSVISSVLAEEHPTPISIIGMRDCFGESGKGEELFDKYGMNTQHIVEAVQKVLEKKKEKKKNSFVPPEPSLVSESEEKEKTMLKEIMKKTLLKIDKKLEAEKEQQDEQEEQKEQQKEEEQEEPTTDKSEEINKKEIDQETIKNTNTVRCTNMEIFVDTADVEAIRRLNAWGIVDGVTTNPSLIAKEGRDFKQVVQEICNIVDGPISAEVVSTEPEGMVREGRDLAKIHPNVVIKVPLTPAGLQATKTLTSEGIKVNVTLCFSANQALLAAKAGATYISPFVGRLDDIGQTGMDLIGEIVTIYKNYGCATKVLAASLRHPEHVKEAALLGAHVSTIPPAVLEKMVKHALTDIGLQKFLKDWEKHKGQTAQTEQTSTSSASVNEIKITPLS